MQRLAGGAGGPWALCPIALTPTSGAGTTPGRSRARLVVCARRSRASKADGDAGTAPEPTPAAAAPPQPPYSEALLAREYELWQRQAAMYERLLAQADVEQARFAEERAAWQATEAALRQEAAELRAQLLFVATQLRDARPAAAPPAPPAGAAAASFAGSSPPAALAGREPAAALPSAGASGGQLSPGEQVRAVVEAAKSGGAAVPPPPAPAAPTASSGVSPSAAWPAGAEGAELPPYAADLAAAVAAVDATDVLAGVGALALRERRGAAKAAAAAAPPKQPSPAAEQLPPAVEQPPPAAELPVEAPGEAAAEVPQGPPPPLTLGADDIFWVNQLHTALVELGYFPGDADIDDFYFGEATQSALMTMQCCEGLAETGIADEATWLRLLGPELRPKQPRDLLADMMLNVPGLTSLGGGGGDGDSGAAADERAPPSGGAQPAYAELFAAAFTESAQPDGAGGVQDVQQLAVADVVAVGGKVVSESVQVTVQQQEVPTEWPVLHEGDGGREVHAMQVALERAGFYPSEDDVRWWSFGDGTLAALKTLQACNGYPESGVCDAATWRFLLGEDATPADLLTLHSGDSADEDLSEQSGDRVWLIGEQRWEDRSRLKRG